MGSIHGERLTCVSELFIFIRPVPLGVCVCVFHTLLFDALPTKVHVSYLQLELLSIVVIRILFCRLNKHKAPATIETQIFLFEIFHRTAQTKR